MISQFSLFPQLPAELQLRIWEFASFEPRFIPGCCSKLQYFIPPLLQVSHNSRQAALWHYRPVVILIKNQAEASLKAVQKLHDTRLSKFPESLDWFPNHLKTIFAFYHSIHDSFLSSKKWDEAEGFAGWISILYESSERVDEAIAVWTRLLDFYCQEGHFDRVGYCAMRIGNLYKSYGRVDEAIAVWIRLFDSYRQRKRLEIVEYYSRQINILDRAVD
jgi:tetratricopeptide (TPR) repeat protein